LALASGVRLGPYEVVSAIGAGGMGEVYRARDTTLNRDVALKILPDAFGTDPERIARFRREAQVLASLNHPNIAAIYGFEDSADTHALVLELVEGPTLADRIAKGPIPLDEAIPIAKQIAEALEAAHEQKIIHRDLKPANIKVRDEGTVKVLDFGLAKLTEAGGGGAGAAGEAEYAVTNSPTITTPAMMTGIGTILGTAAYMSPEQAKGRPADRRSDVWAFGAVLYEMLTGTRAFEGEDVSDTLAAVLRAEPDWTALPPDVSLPIRTLLKRCLEKDRRARIADVSTARFLMGEPTLTTPSAVSVPTVTTQQPSWRRMMLIGTAIVVAAALIGIAMLFAGRRAPAPEVARLVIALPEGHQFSGMNRRMIAISSDGRLIAYVANARLFVRPVNDFEPKAVLGGVETNGLTSPVFSPEGTEVAFYSAPDNTLKRISIAGGVPTTICNVEGPPLGMTWIGDSIVYGQSGRGVLRVAAKSGKPELLVASSAESGALLGPQLLPGNQAALFTVVTSGNLDGAQVAVQVLGSKDRKNLTDGSDARYLTTGHLVYWLRGTLYAVPFDVDRLQLTGTPAPVVPGVNRAQDSPFANFSISDTGTLIYIPGPANTSSRQSILVLVDREGHQKALNVPPGAYVSPRFSPDGTQLAMGIDDGKEANIWVYDLSGNNSIQRLTYGGHNRYPVWVANGERIAFQSDRDGAPGIFWQRADGRDTAERLTKPAEGLSHTPESWSPASQRLSFSETSGDSASLWTVSVNDRKPEQFGDLQSRTAFNSEFSPDGRWLAYTLRSGGRVTSYVQSFPLSGTPYQLPTEAHHAMWSHDSKELFYTLTTNTGGLMAVSFTPQPRPAFGNPSRLAPNVGFRSSPVSPRNHDVALDKRFINVVDAAPTDSSVPRGPQIRVVLNWFEVLKEKVPVK
jgi:serine/threonine-protein kinase